MCIASIVVAFYFILFQLHLDGTILKSVFLFHVFDNEMLTRPLLIIIKTYILRLFTRNCNFKWNVFHSAEQLSSLVNLSPLSNLSFGPSSFHILLYGWILWQFIWNYLIFVDTMLHLVAFIINYLLSIHIMFTLLFQQHNSLFSFIIYYFF